jgi:hypothetical protein
MASATLSATPASARAVAKDRRKSCQRQPSIPVASIRAALMSVKVSICRPA